MGEYVCTIPYETESDVPDFKSTLRGAVPSGWIELPAFIQNLQLSDKDGPSLYKVCVNDYAKTRYLRQAGEGVRLPDLKRNYFDWRFPAGYARARTLAKI